MPEDSKNALSQALDRCGLRSTRQREHVFEILIERQDHPTADEIHARTRETMPTISLATVYNCLETLVQCGLVRAVHNEREPTRYCANLHEHAHFHDRRTGEIFDVDLPPEIVAALKKLIPAGYDTDDVELNFHGHSRG